jgi:hydrogenase nickel incorporation protein HypA/HybF
MHETGIAAELLQMASDRAETLECGAVLRLGVSVGAMSGVVPEALEFAFEALKMEYPRMHEARLDMEFIPVKAACRSCCEEFEFAADLVLWCPHCGAPLEVLAGKDLNLVWLEIADKEEQLCSGSK